MRLLIRGLILLYISQNRQGLFAPLAQKPPEKTGIGNFSTSDGTTHKEFMDTKVQEAFSLWALNGKDNLGDDFNGPGSTDWYTRPLRSALPAFLERHQITSMLDAPCGDGSWMSQVEFPEGFVYLGAEIHPDMVERNNLIYPRKFVTLDITDDLLPDMDLIFVRDCLFHFSDVLILRFFVNLLRTNFKWLLTSTHPRTQANRDQGEFGNIFTPLNLQLPPWNFTEPIDTIEDYDESDPNFEGYPYRNMSLWSKEQVLQTTLEVMKRRLVV